MSGSTRSGDYDLDAARFGGFRKFEKEIGSPMCGHDLSLVSHAGVSATRQAEQARRRRDVAANGPGEADEQVSRQVEAG